MTWLWIVGYVVGITFTYFFLRNTKDETQYHNGTNVVLAFIWPLFWAVAGMVYFLDWARE